MTGTGELTTYHDYSRREFPNILKEKLEKLARDNRLLEPGFMIQLEEALQSIPEDLISGYNCKNINIGTLQKGSSVSAPSRNTGVTRDQELAEDSNIRYQTASIFHQYLMSPAAELGDQTTSDHGETPIGQDHEEVLQYQPFNFVNPREVASAYESRASEIQHISDRNSGMENTASEIHFPCIAPTDVNPSSPIGPAGGALFVFRHEQEVGIQRNQQRQATVNTTSSDVAIENRVSHDDATFPARSEISTSLDPAPAEYPLLHPRPKDDDNFGSLFDDEERIRSSENLTDILAGDLNKFNSWWQE
jgi:hypothetical protein